MREADFGQLLVESMNVQDVPSLTVAIRLSLSVTATEESYSVCVWLS